jgi:hypothetical protein
MRPEHALMTGAFLAEGIYQYGTRMRLAADLDGDGNAEEVEFRYSHGGFGLHIRRFDKTFGLELPTWPGDADGSMPKTAHVAIKDVTNDGLPEVLLALHDGMIDLRVAVYGFNSCEARKRRVLDSTHFSLLKVLDHGQRIAHVLEGGTIMLPYGSAGLVWTCKWTGEQFICSDQD